MNVLTQLSVLGRTVVAGIHNASKIGQNGFYSVSALVFAGCSA